VSLTPTPAVSVSVKGKAKQGSTGGQRHGTHGNKTKTDGPFCRGAGDGRVWGHAARSAGGAIAAIR